MEFIPESEQLFDITAWLLSLHSLFAEPGLLKSKTCMEFTIRWWASENARTYVVPFTCSSACIIKCGFVIIFFGWNSPQTGTEIPKTNIDSVRSRDGFCSRVIRRFERITRTPPQHRVRSRDFKISKRNLWG